jgi:surface antigen
MTRTSTGFVVLALGLTLPAALLAAQWNWLRDAPANYLTEQDWKILTSILDATLESGDDGREVAWNNPDTEHRGTVTPLDTAEEQGVTCRNTRVFNSAGGVTNSGVYRFCRQPDGTWKIAP